MPARRADAQRRDALARMDAGLSAGSLEGALYAYLMGLPAAGFPKLARRVFRVLQVLLQAEPLPLQCRQRREPPAPGSKSSLFSVSFAGPMFTLEPSSTGERGWDDFLIDFNDFASATGRRADLQSIARAEARARRQGVRRAREAVPGAAPAHGSLNRLCNSYFSHLLD